MSKRFFTADLHFGHTNIIMSADRPFDSVEDMNEALVERWNTVVTPTDTVIVLGDVCLGRVEENLALVDRLNGDKVLVPGNHDRVWPGTKRLARWTSVYRNHFIFEGLYGLTTVGNHRVMFSHLPYAGGREDDDRKWPDGTQLHDTGMMLLHGHVHNAWKTRGNQINCGVDVWDYAPVSEDELASLLDEMSGG